MFAYSSRVVLCTPAGILSAKGKKNTTDNIARDTSITVSNAYSSLFLDSLAVENFISKEAKEKTLQTTCVISTIAETIVSHGLMKTGLTEHAQAFWFAHNNVIRQSSDSTIYDRALHQVVDTLLSEDSTYRLNQSRTKSY